MPRVVTKVSRIRGIRDRLPVCANRRVNKTGFPKRGRARAQFDLTERAAKVHRLNSFWPCYLFQAASIHLRRRWWWRARARARVTFRLLRFGQRECRRTDSPCNSPSGSFHARFLSLTSLPPSLPLSRWTFLYIRKTLLFHRVFVRVFSFYTRIPVSIRVMQERAGNQERNRGSKRERGYSSLQKSPAERPGTSEI